MAIFGASFQIGRSALAAYQSALSVAGQNIANVGNPEYARQSGHLAALAGGRTPSGLYPGSGIAMDRLVRHIDSGIESRLRDAVSTRSNAETTHTAMSQVEALYNELTDADLSTRLSEFFNLFSTLQLNPQDSATRGQILTSGASLTDELHRLRSGLVDQVADANISVRQAVDRADAIAREIAELNVAITSGDARGAGVASSLRDRRDGLLRELSQYLNVQVREHENGSVSVYVNSDPLVQDGQSRGLEVRTELQDGLEVFTVRFADDHGLVRTRNGFIDAVVRTRDQSIRGQIEQLDQLARGLIYEVNRVHSTGMGLEAATSLTGTNGVLNVNAALNTPVAGLPFPVRNGVMIVNVRNAATGQEISRQIEVDLDGINGDDTSLASLALALDGVPGLSAVTTADGRLQLVADAGSQVWFSEDTSGALAALGIGGFFTGQDANTIQVESNIASNQNLIAASRSGAPGDGDNAARIALLTDSASQLLAGRTIQQFHSDMFNSVAVETAAALTRFDAADAVYTSLNAQREAVSGVSLDEEAINLAKYQTAYAGAARYVGVIQELTDVLMAIVR